MYEIIAHSTAGLWQTFVLLDNLSFIEFCGKRKLDSIMCEVSLPGCVFALNCHWLNIILETYF